MPLHSNLGAFEPRFTLACVGAFVPGLDLVYWDYYHQSEREYSDMLAKHQKLGSNTFFAGGIWTWCGPAPDYTKTINAALPALEAYKKAHVPVVIAAVWGDNGAEANFQTALLGMQLYAEYTYIGRYHEHDLGRRFACCCKGDADAFWGLSSFKTVPGMRAGTLRPVNAAKFLLYQDPFVQPYAGDTQGLAMAEHYRRLGKEYESYGRCVYHCDNDVVDHQVVALRFDGNITATFTMSAFTEKCYRSIKVMGALGEIEGDMDHNVLWLRKFGQPEQRIDLGGIPDRFAGHGGGDALMMNSLCDLVACGEEESLTSIDSSVESHVMALAAEKARIAGRTVVLDEFMREA